MTKRTWRFVWLAYWLVLFVLTHIPVSPHIPGIRNGDKLLHLIAYFVLTFLGGWAANRPVAPRFLAGWALVYAMYGVVDEYLQRFTGRSMTFGDLAADWLGIAVATAILWVTVRREPDRPCD
jgi:VanZ family protein